MIKEVDILENHYSLVEVDKNFRFKDDNGEEIFPEQKRDVSNIRVGKNWPIEGLCFADIGNAGREKVIRDERVIEKIRDQVEKWAPHDEELAEKILNSLGKKDKHGSLLDLPDEIEAYYKKSDEKLILFHTGNVLPDPDKEILWPANSIKVIILLYWINQEESEVNKRHWHKNKDKPQFPKRKPYWSEDITFDIRTVEGMRKYGEDVGETFSNGTYRCVNLQQE